MLNFYQDLQLSKIENEIEKKELEKELKQGRQSGKTTRLVDSLIQELFEKGKCCCINETNKTKLNLGTMQKVLSRLLVEHFINNSQLKISLENFTIEFN